MSKAIYLAPLWKRLVVTGSFAVFAMANHGPAQAFALTAPLSLAATGILNTTCQPSSNFAPAAAGIATAALGISKSEAILGGAMSALDRIRAEQAQLRAPQPAFAVSGTSTSPANAGALHCANMALTMPSSIHDSLSDGLASGSSSDNFLATSRIAIRQTTFSGKWDRVSAISLTRNQVNALTGIPEVRGAAEVQLVNRWVNQTVTYGEDLEVWGVRDYWATAEETLSLRRGDCEDLAILKYQMLLALGVDPQDMYLTLARDLVRNADHAVLVVRLDDRFYMLDNSTDAILPANLSYDYRPTLSFNSQSAWLHGAFVRPPTQQLAYLSVSATPSPRVIGLSR